MVPNGVSKCLFSAWPCVRIWYLSYHAKKGCLLSAGLVPLARCRYSSTSNLTSATAALAIFFSSVRSSASRYFSQLSSPSLAWMLSVS